MIPKFSSQAEMTEYLKSFPKDTDYSTLLLHEFGVCAPEDAQPFHKEYYFKYLVQGKFLGRDGEDLFSYAAEKTFKFAKDFPHVIQNFIPNEVVNEPRIYVKRQNKQDMDGVVQFHEKSGKYKGYIGGKPVTRAPTAEKCLQNLKERYGIEGVLIGE